MFITSALRKLFLAGGYDFRKIEKSENPYLNLRNWDYQKKVVLPELPKNGIVFDLGSGHNPVPEANILGDFFPEDTHHRASALIEDRPMIVCSVERIPLLEKKIDFVICSHILEHVDSPIRAGKELGRIAKNGYIETPGYGKDILVGTGNMHRWQVVEFEGTMYFFEYSDRQREGHVTSPVMDLWCSKEHHPWQDFFWERMDLFNAMHLWKGAPQIIEHRRKGSVLTDLPTWKPISESALPKRPSSLTDKEIELMEDCLAGPDGMEPMKFIQDKFVNSKGTIVYPVRGKRIYFEMAQ
jgi:SAM-dependent methyltransferase